MCATWQNSLKTKGLFAQIPLLLLIHIDPCPGGIRITIMRTVFYCHMRRMVQNQSTGSHFSHFFRFVVRDHCARPSSVQFADFAACRDCKLYWPRCSTGIPEDVPRSLPRTRNRNSVALLLTWRPPAFVEHFGRILPLRGMRSPANLLPALLWQPCCVCQPTEKLRL